MDVQCQESQEAVVKCSQRRVRPALARLDLEEPDADVDGQTQWAGVGSVVVGGQLGEGDALAGAEFLEKAVDAHGESNATKLFSVMNPWFVERSLPPSMFTPEV